MDDVDPPLMMNVDAEGQVFLKEVEQKEEEIKIL